MQAYDLPYKDPCEFRGAYSSGGWDKVDGGRHAIDDYPQVVAPVAFREGPNEVHRDGFPGLLR